MKTLTTCITHSSIGKIMMNNLPRFLMCTALPSVTATAIAFASVTAHATGPTLAAVQQKLSAMSIPFVPNGGQWDSRAAFAAQTFAGTLFVTTEGQLVYSLPGKRIDSPESVGGVQGTNARASDPSPFKGEVRRGMGFDDGANLRAREPHPHPRPPLDGEGAKQARSPGWVLTETLVDAKGQPRKLTRTAQKKPHGELPTEGKVSYATARATENLNTYERVNLGEMYPGVNVHLRATGKNVEKIFTVAPNQNPAQIRIKLEGAEKLEIGNEGQLIAHTGNGPVAFTAPIAFQDIHGVRHDVPAQYALITQTQEYGFTLGSFDKSWPLVIDPLLQSTYNGGNGDDIAYGIAIHPATGDVYVAGETNSAAFPDVANGAQTLNSGLKDAFVTRFNAALTTRLQSTYLGGNGDDSARAIAIHPASGEVYVSGITHSINFPGTTAPTPGAQPAFGGFVDAFVSRFNATLTTHLQSTYHGGDSSESAYALAIHPGTGDAYIAGTTGSSNMPGADNGAQSTKSGSTFIHAFVTRFNAALTTRRQSTYHGSADGAYEVRALAIHPVTSEVYLVGFTSSPTLPSAANGAQPTKSGGRDAYVTRFNAALTVRAQSTYLGGNGSDTAYAAAIHPITGDVYIVGDTGSDPFPNTVNGAQPGYGMGPNDGFVSRLNAALTAHLQSTYLGGSGDDIASAIAIDRGTGEVVLAGYTSATNFPGTSAGAQAINGGGTDAFVSRFNAALTSRLQSSYLGGGLTEVTHAVAIHPGTGEVYVAGQTDSNNLPAVLQATGGVANGAQFVKANANDAFLSRFSPDLTVVNRIPNPFSFIHQSHVPPNTIRTSNEVRLIITPNPGNNQQAAYVTGATNSEFCVANQSGICVKPYVGCGSPCFGTGWLAASNPPYQFLSGDYVAVSHTSAASGTAETKLIVSGVAYPFRSSTGNANVVCNLDMNGDNQVSATVEGLILVRAMLGLGADAIIAGTGVNAWDPVRVRLNEFCGTTFPFSPSAFQ